MYTSEENIAAALGRALTDSEVLYYSTVLGDSIVKYIDSITGTSWTGTTADVSISGEDSNLLIIPTMQTVTAVRNEDGDVISSDNYTLIPSVAPYLAIKHKTSTWDKGFWNYTLSGTGVSTVPADITYVATELAMSALSAPTNGVKSEKVGDWSATYSDTTRPLSATSDAILRRYRRLSRAV